MNRFGFLLALLLLSVACTGAPSVVSIPTLTPAPLPEAGPGVSDVPAPTLIPAPTSTPPPTLQRLGEYLQTLQGRSSSWRTCSVQALRMYRLHVGKPELADVVWLPRHMKDA